MKRKIYQELINWKNTNIQKPLIDCEASLNEEQLTNEGVDFLDKYYDKFLMAVAKEKYGKENSIAELDKLYKEYKNN